jgi:uncharacterized protein (TIGR02597 family)
MLATATSHAQTNVYTDPVGFYKVDLLTNSDTYVSVPFTRMPEYQGLIAGVSGSTISISNSPGWSAGQWSTANANGYFPYYAKIQTGTKEGAYYTVTNNGADTLDVVLAPEDLSSVAAGNQIRIIPFWTLNTVFPGGTGVVASVSATISGRRTQILFPDLTTDGINLSASATFYYFNNAWRKQGVPATSNLNETVILPDQYVIGRQQNNADTTTMVAPGQVVLSKVRIPLYANPVATTTNQDNAVAIYRPSVQTLNESQLTNAFVASTTATLAGRRDQLLTIDNSVQGINKSASATYYYFNNGWRKQGVPATVDFGPSNIFNPATGVIVRKVTNDTTTAIWVNPANYSN